MKKTTAATLVRRLISAGKTDEAAELVQAFDLRNSLKRNHLDPLEVQEGLADLQDQEVEQSLQETGRFIPASAQEIQARDLTVPREKFPPPTFPARKGGMGPFPPGSKRGQGQRARGVFPGMPPQGTDRLPK